MTTSTLAALHPELLPRPEDLRTRPEIVQAALPSDIVTKYIRNINALEQCEALAALLNATIVIGLIRDVIAGCEIASAIQIEFPIVFVYPTAGTPEGTTNNGKTTLCRFLGGALVPGLPVTLVNKSASSPAQRAMAATRMPRNAATLSLPN